MKLDYRQILCPKNQVFKDFGPKNFGKKYLIQKTSGPVQTYNGLKMFGPEKVWVQKNVGQKYCVSKKFCFQKKLFLKYFGSKKYFG